MSPIVKTIHIDVCDTNIVSNDFPPSVVSDAVILYRGVHVEFVMEQRCLDVAAQVYMLYYLKLPFSPPLTPVHKSGFN